MKTRILHCSILLLAAGSLPAAEMDFAVRGGVNYSDNIERLSDGLERSSSAAVVGIELNGARPAGRMRYDVMADLSYNEYLSLDLDPELFGRAALQGAYDFVPGTFGWNGRLAYEQIRSDILSPLVPGNSEGLLSFSTGPTLKARFSSTLEGQLDGHYVRTSYGDRPFDNETVGARTLLIRRASPRALWAVGGSYDDVSYVSGGAPADLDFRRREFFLRTELSGVRTDINFEAGYADIRGRTVDDGGPMLRARLSRRMTPSLTGFVSAVREYPTSEDAARSFDSSATAGAEYDSALLTSGPRQTTQLEGGFRFDRPRVQAELAYSRRNEEAAGGVSAERTLDELRGRFTRRFTPRAQGSLYATIANEDYSGATGSADERTAGVELGFNFGQALGLTFRVEHRKRDGSAALSDYSELSGGVFLRYAGSLRADAGP
jgi:hypothetical protein